MATGKPRVSAPDYAFISLLVVLTVFGLVMLTSASSDLAKAQFGDSYYYLKHQLMLGLLPGIAGFFLGAFVYYRRWGSWATPLLIVSIVLLILVFTPLGFGAKGSARALHVGSITFQPGELLKLAFLMYLAVWVSRNQARSRNWKDGFLPFLVLLGMVMGLLFLQPSTSTAVVLFGASILTYFTAGARLRFLAVAGLLACLVLSLLVTITPYRFARVATFLNPTSDPYGASYQANQALITIGAGGLWGVGYGQSTTKLNALPEPIGDSIFAVIANELGFVGAAALVVVYLLLVLRGLVIARSCPDNFGRLLATGFASLIGFQAFMNIAAISGVIPLTGLPLPFVSYGGTALTVLLTMGGVIVNISRYRTRR